MSTFHYPARTSIAKILRDLLARVRRLEGIPARAKFSVKLFADAAWADSSSLTVTGNGRFIFEIDDDDLDGAYLIDVWIWCTVAGTGATSVQVRNVTTTNDMLSTPLSIDTGELSSRTAAVQRVISTTFDQVTVGDQIAVDIDTAPTGQKGLGITFKFGGF